jgi:uncharacterized protein YjbI with pentapeptide repeats
MHFEVIGFPEGLERLAILNHVDTANASWKKVFLKGANLRGMDLRGRSLRKADLRKADLSGAILRGVDLRLADLREADLRGANLVGADLEKAQLNHAKLTGAVLLESCLRETEMIGAELEGNAVLLQGESGAWDVDEERGTTVLSGSKMEGAKLRESRMRGAKLERCVFVGANFEKAILNSAMIFQTDFRECNLQGASFRGADIVNSRFYNCNLQNTDLTRACLRYTHVLKSDLRSADLYGADLRGTHLKSVDLYRAKFSQRWFAQQFGGIVMEGVTGNETFTRFVKDQTFIDEFRNRGRLHYLMFLLWKVTSDCGRSFFLWLLWATVFAIVFAVYYGANGDSFSINTALPDKPFTYFYYSVVTMTTLGFGDVTPLTSTAAAWVMAEVVLGYLMLGGLLSILANKLARRS